jgi:hypothetical protein
MSRLAEWHTEAYRKSADCSMLVGKFMAFQHSATWHVNAVRLLLTTTD